MTKLSNILNRIGNILVLSMKRFPETIFISTALVVFAIMKNHSYNYDNMVLTKLILVLALGIPISICLLLVQERLKSSLLFRAIGILLLINYGTLFFRLIPMDITEKFAIRYAFASAIFYLLFTLVPYLLNRKEYSLYIIKLATSFFITYLYTLVLYLGIIAIIFTVDQLFNLNINSDIYFDTFIIAVGIFGLTYYLGRIPKLSDTLDDYNYPLVLRVLFVSIIMPLVTVYTAVLYAYLIRIIVTMTWPQGIVSNLVTWYGFVSILLLLVTEPLIPTSPWTTKFRKYLPIAITVPLIMLIVSIMIRINAYGITILRYLVVAAWIWLATSILYLIFRKKGSYQYLMISFILIFTIAMFSPINGFKVSINSQVNRLENILEDNSMLKDGLIIPNQNLDTQSQSNISSIMSYLDKEKSFDHISILPNDFNLDDMEAVFGFTYNGGYYSDGTVVKTVDFSYAEPSVNVIKDYDYHASIRVYDKELSSLNTDDITIEVQSNNIVVSKGGSIIQTIEVVKLLDENSIDIGFEYKQADAPIVMTKTYDHLKMMLVINELHGQVDNDNLDLNYYEGDMYFSIIE